MYCMPFYLKLVDACGTCEFLLINKVSIYLFIYLSLNILIMEVLYFRAQFALTQTRTLSHTEHSWGRQITSLAPHSRRQLFDRGTEIVTQQYSDTHIYTRPSRDSWVGRQATSCQCVCVCVSVWAKLFLISKLSWWQQTRVKLCRAALSVCGCWGASFDFPPSWHVWELKTLPNHFWGAHPHHQETHTHTHIQFMMRADRLHPGQAEYSCYSLCFLFVEQMFHNDTHRQNLELLHLKSTGNSLCGFIACSLKWWLVVF